MKTIMLASISDQIQGQLHYWMNDWKGLLLILFIGAVAGLLAEFLIGSKGFGMLVTIILGMVGGWLGNIIFRHYLNLTNNELINRIINATAGAMIIVIVLSLIFRLKGRDRTEWRA